MPMTCTIPEFDIHIVHPPHESQSLQTYASIFRKLRLQSLQGDQEAFTEKYDTASRRPAVYWYDSVRLHNGLIHIAFGVTQADASKLAGTSSVARTNLTMELGTPIGMALNTGPIPQDYYVSLPGSQVLPDDRPHSQEHRFYIDMLYLVPEMRGPQREPFIKSQALDQDEWLLRSLQSAATDPPPVARLSGNVRPGHREKNLLAFYTSLKWYIAGTQTWRSNLLAKGGPGAVQEGEARGDDMDQVSTVVEKIVTVEQLQSQIKERKVVLGKVSARL